MSMTTISGVLFFKNAQTGLPLEVPYSWTGTTEEVMQLKNQDIENYQMQGWIFLYDSPAADGEPIPPGPEEVPKYRREFRNNQECMAYFISTEMLQPQQAHERCLELGYTPTLPVYDPEEDVWTYEPPPSPDAEQKVPDPIRKDPETGKVSLVVPKQDQSMYWLYGLILLKLAQMPGGMQTIRMISQEFIKGVFTTLKACAQASPGSDIASWAYPMLISNIFNRMGFLNPGVQEKYEIGISIMAGADIAAEFFEDITKMFKFTKTTRETVEGPATIVYSGDTPILQATTELRPPGDTE